MAPWGMTTDTTETPPPDPPAKRETLTLVRKPKPEAPSVDADTGDEAPADDHAEGWYEP
jgi:hypothetical protein